MQQLDEDSLNRLIDLLNESQIPDNIKQQEVHQKINELSHNPEFCNYILYIFALDNNPNLNTVRKIAGVTLKGLLERNWEKLSPQNLDNIKSTLFKVFYDSNTKIRSTVANVLTTLFTKVGNAGWLEIISFIETNLEQNTQEIVETSLECISKIFEDLKTNSENMNHLNNKTYEIFSGLILKLIMMCDPKYPQRIKELSIHCLNTFIQTMDPKLLNDYFNILLVYSEDQDPSLRLKSCEGFLETLELRKELLLQYLDQTFERMLTFTTDQNYKVKRAACRFWSEYLLVEKGEPPNRILVVQKILSLLVPALIDCLQFTQEDFINQDKSNQGQKPPATGYEDTGEESEGSDGEEGGHTGDWTLRKEAAKALDFLARHFKGKTFDCAQVKIADYLKSNEWVIRESGIYCLGVFASGALSAITPHLKDLFPFLMNNLKDENVFIRSISFWTLSKYTEWIAAQGKVDANIMKDYLTEILKAMMENNTQVQNSACTALGKAISEYAQSIEPYLSDIVQVFEYVSNNYQKNNLANLYDVIALLAQNVARSKIQDEKIENVLMGIIAKRWKESQFNDIESIYLVECTDSLLTALEHKGANYTEFFFTKSVFLIYNYLQARQNNDKMYMYHKKEVALRAFEIFSTFLKVIGNQAERYMSQADFKQIYEGCLEDTDIVLKQFILSCVGDVAKYCPNLIKDFTKEIALVLMDNLTLVDPNLDIQEEVQFTCNNAAFSIGELAIAFPYEFANYASDFALRICDLFDSGFVTIRGLQINLSIAIGKISFVQPEATAQLLDRFLGFFSSYLIGFKGNKDKQNAFRGLFNAISKNPNGIVKNFVFLCQALVTFEDAEPDVQNFSSKLILNFKNIAGQEWFSFFNSFPKELQDQMRQKYGV